MPRIGYAPYDRGLARPGDRRRFPYYARLRGVEFEVADPSTQYDLVIVAAQADIVTWAQTGSQTRVIYDLIDSYLEIPHLMPKNLLRGLSKYVGGELARPVLSHRRAVERMCGRADAVVCATDEQAEAIGAFCDNVHVILDFHDELGDHTKEDYGLGATLNIVWEGLPVTLAPLRYLTPVFQALSKRRPVALHVITDPVSYLALNRYGRRPTEKFVRGLHQAAYVYDWNLFALTRIATACDIAVVPLDRNDPMSFGKPANKLGLFWRLGLPTIASASPAHIRAMNASGVNLACDAPEEWLATLELLTEDDDLRSSAALAGRQYVYEHQRSTVIALGWDRVMESVL